MLETAFVGALISALGLIFLILKGGKDFVLKILGYDAFVDILVTVGFALLFSMSGTISGMFAGIMTGVVISLVLLIAKKTIGYQRLEKVVINGKTKRRWVQHPPRWADLLNEYWSKEI